MGKVALVTGASGISGRAIIEHLCKQNHWTKILAISRRKPSFIQTDSRVEFVSIDLMKSAQELAKNLHEIGAEIVTHLFFTAYIHGTDEQDLIKKNGTLFVTFLEAFLPVASSVERIFLQTGGKYYGVHKGPVPTPTTEETPRHSGENFYFVQEDALISAQKGKNWGWNIMRPSVIVGASEGNGMSMASTLAIYFQVQKELNRPAIFPGNPVNYYGRQDVSSSDLAGHFAVWMTTNEHTSNQAFNFVDGDTKTWEDLWKGIAQYFGVPVEEPKFKDHVRTPTKKMQHEYLLSEYMKDKKPVWETICQRHGGDKQAWDHATFEFADFIFGMSWTNEFPMTKAKKFGWVGSVDSVEAFRNTFDLMKREGYYPKHLE